LPPSTRGWKRRRFRSDWPRGPLPTTEVPPDRVSGEADRVMAEDRAEAVSVKVPDWVAVAPAKAVGGDSARVPGGIGQARAMVMLPATGWDEDRVPAQGPWVLVTVPVHRVLHETLASGEVRIMVRVRWGRVMDPENRVLVVPMGSMEVRARAPVRWDRAMGRVHRDMADLEPIGPVTGD
jgi:hypothetical protein